MQAFLDQWEKVLGPPRLISETLVGPDGSMTGHTGWDFEFVAAAGKYRIGITYDLRLSITINLYGKGMDRCIHRNFAKDDFEAANEFLNTGISAPTQIQWTQVEEFVIDMSKAAKLTRPEETQ